MVSIIIYLGGKLFEDPLSELGINLRRGYENTALIRKIRKEQQLVMDEIDLKKKQEELQIQTDKNTKQEEYIFLKPIYAAEAVLGKVTKKTQETWSTRFSPDAVRQWISTSRYMRPWMFFQVFVTVLAIANYISLTYIVNQDEGVLNINYSGTETDSKGLGFVV
jgi:hypothetical protein